MTSPVEEQPEAPAAAPYRPALTIGALLTVVSVATWATGSIVVPILLVAACGVCAWYAFWVGHDRGLKRGRDRWLPHLRESRNHLNVAMQRNKALEDDQQRMVHAVEVLATRWEALAPSAIPYQCVRELREVLPVRLEVGG